MKQIPLYESQPAVRALTWKQPFASLMLRGKIETRTRKTNIRGKVLICAGAQPYGYTTLTEITGNPVSVIGLLHHAEMSKRLPFGKAIAIGELVDCRLMTEADEEKCFVRYRPGLWCWIFENVQAIEPFPFKGKQGWSFITPEVEAQIKVLSTTGKPETL